MYTFRCNKYTTLDGGGVGVSCCCYHSPKPARVFQRFESWYKYLLKSVFVVTNCFNVFCHTSEGVFCYDLCLLHCFISLSHSSLPFVCRQQIKPTRVNLQSGHTRTTILNCVKTSRAKKFTRIKKIETHSVSRGEKQLSEMLLKKKRFSLLCNRSISFFSQSCLSVV